MTNPKNCVDSNNNGWRKYALHIAGAAIGLLLLALGGLVTMGLGQMNRSIESGFAQMQKARDEDMGRVERYFTENRREMRRLCDKVAEHDAWLRLPYKARREYFLAPRQHEEPGG